MDTPLLTPTIAFPVSAAVSDVKVTNSMIPANLTRVLIIYTGGTLGMKHTKEFGYIPAKGALGASMKQNWRFHDPEGLGSALGYPDGIPPPNNGQWPACNGVNVVQEYPLGVSTSSSLSPLLSGDKSMSTTPQASPKKVVINGTPVVRSNLPALITPPSLYGKRTLYSILEYDTLLDSSNMNMSDWIRIATDVEVNYSLYDAFIIIHGTDTMSYTASALSFMLEDLGKTVILTGSQVPLAEVRNDALENLLGALTIAGHFVIPEVSLYFNNRLYRGNRSSKSDALDFEAFETPNCDPLVTVGTKIKVDWSLIQRPRSLHPFRAHKKMDPNVAALRIFPGITESTIEAFLKPPIRGVVLETYGAGNAPSNRPDLLRLLGEASKRGVVIVNTTQCRKGHVSSGTYATGRALLEQGVVPGGDMTTECALAKLGYLLSKDISPEECRRFMQRDLRGEMTREDVGRFSMPDLKVSPSLKLLLTLRDKVDDDVVDYTAQILPLLLANAAGTGNLGEAEYIMTTCNAFHVPLQQLLNAQVGALGRTALHLACAGGWPMVVSSLLRHGANVHIKDREGHTPLWDALFPGEGTTIQDRRHCVDLILQTGGHIGGFLSTNTGTMMIRSGEGRDITWKLFQAVANNDLETVQLLWNCDVDFTRGLLPDRRTIVHVCSTTPVLDILKWICQVKDQKKGISLNVKDVWGKTPLDDAMTLSKTSERKSVYEQAITMLLSAGGVSGADLH